MDVFPKFIIEKDSELGLCLIIAKCTFHKQLVTDIKQVRGGGLWKRDGQTFILSGTSHDFGSVKLEDLKDCVTNKNIYSSSALYRNLSNEFTFKYINECGEIIDL